MIVPPALPVVRVIPGSFGTGQPSPAFKSWLNKTFPFASRICTQDLDVAETTKGDESMGGTVGDEDAVPTDGAVSLLVGAA
jgi:hypothetical protein